MAGSHYWRESGLHSDGPRSRTPVFRPYFEIGIFLRISLLLTSSRFGLYDAIAAGVGLKKWIGRPFGFQPKHAEGILKSGPAREKPMRNKSSRSTRGTKISCAVQDGNRQLTGYLEKFGSTVAHASNYCQRFRFCEGIAAARFSLLQFFVVTTASVELAGHVRQSVRELAAQPRSLGQAILAGSSPSIIV